MNILYTLFDYGVIVGRVFALFLMIFVALFFFSILVFQGFVILTGAAGVVSIMEILNNPPEFLQEIIPKN